MPEELIQSLVQAPRGDEPLRPVVCAEALDAHDALRARRVDELVVADDDADVRRAARGGLEEHQVARLRSRGLIFLPSPNCSSTERGSAMPLRAKTYWVKPLQSNPPGSTPPFR